MWHKCISGADITWYPTIHSMVSVQRLQQLVHFSYGTTFSFREFSALFHFSLSINTRSLLCTLMFKHSLPRWPLFYSVTSIKCVLKREWRTSRYFIQYLKIVINDPMINSWLLLFIYSYFFISHLYEIWSKHPLRVGFFKCWTFQELLCLDNWFFSMNGDSRFMAFLSNLQLNSYLIASPQTTDNYQQTQLT